MADMTLEQVVKAVARELKVEQLLSTDEGRAAVAAVVNKAMADLETKLTSEIAEERKLRTAAEEGVKELSERLSRRERLDRDHDFHVDRNGQLRPSVSRDCADHLITVMRAAHTGNRALSAGTDSEGGYLVQPEYASELIRLMPTVGLFPRIARQIPMISDEKNFGTLISAFTAYWPNESTAITPSFPAFGQLKLVAKILAAYTEAPENLLDDATPDMGQLIGDLIVEALAGELDRVGIAGKTASGDPFNGVLNATGVVAKVMDNTKTKISDVNADYLLDLQTTVPDGAREGCLYLLSPTVFDAVRKLKNTQGDYIVQLPTAGAPGTIWGKPYELTEKLPSYSTAATASKRFVAYGNFKKAAMLGNRKQISLKVSDVAGDTMKKIQTAIRAHGRFAVESYGPAIAVLETAAA